jgi:endogenous inhibitor of DNA gyrase (YacG/DUF329 family)
VRVTKVSLMDFTPRCPSCRAAVRWEGNPHRPFCSERCRLVDLGAWVTERYRVPGASIEPDAGDGDEDGSE